jgi:hypothetical protein
MHEFFDDIVPHPEGVDPEHDLVHERAYVVRAYRKDDSTLLMRGAVRDQKPPGLYVRGDPDPLTMHHMIVDLTVTMPGMEITAAKVVMEVHPHTTCRRIEDHYQSLVGLSIARGFTHKIRELFGGPRGCTHTTALLQAMAPVAIQSTWSFQMATRRTSSRSAMPRDDGSQESRMASLAMNLNSCHVWDEHGEIVQGMRAGQPAEYPLSLRRRVEELGLDFDAWVKGD